MTHREMARERSLPGLVVLLTTVVVSGCAEVNFQTIAKLQRGTSDLKVLMMPIDIELSEITAGGVRQPNANWTALAEQHINTALTGKLQARNALMVPYKAPEAGSTNAHAHTQLVKLHQAVGASIVLHNALPHLRLPTKVKNDDWTLGPEVRRLAAGTGAEYALFVHIRDSYASEGRAAVMVLAILFAGAVLHGGSQVGFASLIDLRTGDVVWFNQLARVEGDLRTAQAAEESVAVLLQNFPK